MDVPHGLVVNDCASRLYVADREGGAVHQFELIRVPLAGSIGEAGARRRLEADAEVLSFNHAKPCRLS